MNTQTPTFREFFRSWLRLGFTNFGGSDEQIDRMRHDLVAARGWFTDTLFLRGRDFCALLPGMDGHQLAVYLGWRLFGLKGGAVAGLLVLLPSALLLLALSWLAAACGDTPVVAGAFRGIAGAVVAIVAQALWRMSKKALVHPVFYGFAAAGFLMEYALRLKFYGIVVTAVLMGLWLGQVRPDLFCLGASGPQGEGREGSGAAEDDAPEAAAGSPWRRVGRLAAWFAVLWLAVALPVVFLSGPDSLLPRILNFYGRASLLAFGGAYGVLSFVSDMALRLGWTGQDQLALGLGLGGLAPGPLLLAAQHAGFMTAFGHPGGLAPLTAGLLGGLLATFGLFLPGFFLVFAGAPHARAFCANPRLRSALTGINAAMVGVILKLGVLFATAAFWPRGFAQGFGAGLDSFAVGIAVVACLALWRFKAGVHVLVLVCGAAGAAWTLLG